MAREIRYIEPVESISGDLGQKQTLRYARNNNPAWDAPANTQNSARNYKTTYVGLKRRLSGRNYFAVRKRSTFTSSPAMLKNCAVMGGTYSILSAARKDLNLRAQMDILYVQYRNAGGTMSLMQWLAMQVRRQVLEQASIIVISYLATSVSLGNNPFGNATTAIDIPAVTLAKFYSVLYSQGVTFYVGSERAISAQGSSIGALIAIPRMNVLGLQNVNGYIKYGNFYLINDLGVALRADVSIRTTVHYTLSPTLPTV